MSVIKLIPCKYIIIAEPIPDSDHEISIKQFVYSKCDSSVQAGEFMWDYKELKMIEVLQNDPQVQALTCKSSDRNQIIYHYRNCGRLLASDDQIGWILIALEGKYVPIGETHIKQILDNDGDCSIVLEDSIIDADINGVDINGLYVNGGTVQSPEKIKAKLIDGKIILRIK